MSHFILFYLKRSWRGGGWCAVRSQKWDCDDILILKMRFHLITAREIVTCSLTIDCRGWDSPTPHHKERKKRFDRLRSKAGDPSGDSLLSRFPGFPKKSKQSFSAVNSPSSKYCSKIIFAVCSVISTTPRWSRCCLNALYSATPDRKIKPV